MSTLLTSTLIRSRTTSTKSFFLRRKKCSTIDFLRRDCSYIMTIITSRSIIKTSIRTIFSSTTIMTRRWSKMSITNRCHLKLKLFNFFSKKMSFLIFSSFNDGPMGEQVSKAKYRPLSTHYSCGLSLYISEQSNI